MDMPHGRISRQIFNKKWQNSDRKCGKRREEIFYKIYPADSLFIKNILARKTHPMCEEIKLGSEKGNKMSDFIRDIIDEDLRTNKHKGRVATRFPPEPNGYPHIGHAKSVCLNFGIAAQYGGACNLRMDDTDPSGESMEYVESIIRDVRWIGFDWDDRLYYASDYYENYTSMPCN